ncbi:bacteriocin immunity protein [Actinoallomurus rhizosphaericola]|uniref:bacteriocin immunity protein n=1 Tax=Actinoallomurus rhizosphaericola TaxID=2952536 RepID=UPI002093A8C5|nr:bacteriocin immunity protein [Actinoallomurus rhizosphaericola]MCO5995929.1 bacteriocin immunity protein [Actinoallomurus rhizosphaericola]
MNLRPELLPPATDQERLAEIGEEIERIADLARRGRRSAADEAIAAFNARTGHDYALHDFVEYCGSRSLEEFAREAARPAWPRIPDITRPELVEIVRRILAADRETDFYLELFQCNTPHPGASDLIFNPPADLDGGSAEAIVDAALSYRAIAL